MEVIRDPRVIQARCRAHREAGRRVGLVPTMGALHEGHLSLLRRCRAESDLAVMSLFVNPTQFDRKDDLDAYPRDLDRDLAKAAECGTDLILAPPAEAMYPAGFSTFVTPGPPADRMEGASRPGHFRGVATVVTKLFHLVQPHRAYFGAKDYQQSVVVRRMVADLAMDLEIVVCPTVRDVDGLALSSRNASLSPDERRAAPILYRALRMAEDSLKKGERQAGVLAAGMRALIDSEPLARLDYIEVCHPETLEPVTRVEGPVVICLAARIGRVRLLDNLRVEG